MVVSRISRRALLLGTALGLLGSIGTATAARKHAQGAKKAAATQPQTGVQIPYPPLVDVGAAGPYELVAQAATHAFLKDKPVAVVGYGGTYMGPALRVRRGTTAQLRLVNRLDRPTNVHWHGLLVEGRFDGGTHPGIAPGETWEASLAVDQPAATLWYHAHVHGSTTRDVHDGLAGLLIVEDEKSSTLGLPATWGVDDLPLVLQDRDFDADGKPVLPPLASALEHGFRGRTPIVNGVAEARARVPERLVRLRLLNACGARTFRLAFEDRRTFRLIAGDAGFLAAPVELSFLPLAPGERAEILVDFTAGASPLMTDPDAHEHRAGREVVTLPDVLTQSTRLLDFEVRQDSVTSHAVPKALVPLAALPETTIGLTRRRFELRVVPGAESAMSMPGHAQHMMHPVEDHAGHGGGDQPAGDALPAPKLTINGKSFAMGRIDEKVAFGATEVWEIVSPEMAHPFHLHGAHFRVLSEDGEQAKLWNGGPKDTILVDNSAEILVTFRRRADATAPFVYHCHLLEHEDGGMMGAFTVA